MATEFRLAQWAQGMQERKASGQSVADFCEARGVSRNTYFYWQRRLREAAALQLGASAEPGAGTQALVPSGWATVSAAEEAVPERTNGLVLRIGGAEIEVCQGFDEALLASVCKMLTGLC